MTKNRIYWILTIAVIASLTIPTLAQEGMFLDGVTYSAVSKNMANGYGTPLAPHYTKTLYPEFHEQPPLVLIIQSWFFTLFGKAFYTERIFSLFILVLSIIGIRQCWRLVAEKNELKEYDWFPVLLWISIPLVSWSYKNNLLENTMGVFTIFAVFSVLKSLLEKKVIYLFTGSVLVVLGFISKGFAGLFPIVVPVLYAIVYKPDKKTIQFACYLILLTLAIVYVSFLLFPGLTNNISLYLDQHFIPAINNKREITTGNRVDIILKLFIALSFPLALLIYIIARQWKKTGQLVFLRNNKAFIFLLIALTASIPLIISLKQRKYYLIPSIPFYVLSISFLVIPFIKLFLEKLSVAALVWIKRVSLVTLALVILFAITQFGEFSRDREKLMDIYAISRSIPEGTVLSTTKDLSLDWVLVAYMSRVGYLSLDGNNEHKYYLLENNSTIENRIPGNYEKVDLKLSTYVILKRKS